MNANNVSGEKGNQQPATQDDTSVHKTTDAPNAPQPAKVNKIDNNTKLENELDNNLHDDD